MIESQGLDALLSALQSNPRVIRVGIRCPMASTQLVRVLNSLTRHTGLRVATVRTAFAYE